MKCMTWLGFVAVFAALAITSTPAHGASIPEPLDEGFRLLQLGKAHDALMTWGKGSLWTNQQEFIESSTLALGKHAEAFGRLQVPEQIAHVQLTPSIDLYWYALVYDRGVLYLWFEVLNRDGQTTVTSMSRYNDVRELSVSLSLFDSLLNK